MSDSQSVELSGLVNMSSKSNSTVKIVKKVTKKKAKKSNNIKQKQKPIKEGNTWGSNCPTIPHQKSQKNSNICINVNDNAHDDTTVKDKNEKGKKKTNNIKQKHIKEGLWWSNYPHNSTPPKKPKK